jgi:uncharacterized damage-inducible protein DinB
VAWVRCSSRGRRIAKGFFLLHAIEHGVEHRTEIKVTLALIGIATPDLDGWFYSQMAGYGREVAAKTDPRAV